MSITYFSSLSTYLILNIIISLNVFLTSAGCPKDEENRFRLNKTRFFIIQRLGSLDEVVDWNGAQDKCKEHGLKLATIDSYGEDAVVGRALEKFVQDNNHAIGIERYSKYWIDAKYDPDQESYIWVAENRKLEYSNILYKSKTVGYGNDLSADGNIWQPDERGPQFCLTYGISYAKPGEEFSFLGYETRMEEWPCDQKAQNKKRYALCEAKKKDCPNPEDEDPMVMTDSNNDINIGSKDYYLNKGNWIFGSPRRFAVNWEPRTMPDAIEYCQDRGMYLYRPSTSGDGCLIPYLGLWNKRITTATFWTRIKFIIGTKMYLWPNGEEISIGKPYTNATTRSSKKSEDVYACVMSAYSYEPFGSNACKCQWNSLVLAPANCGLKMATICSHIKENTNDTLGSCGDIWGKGEKVYDSLDTHEGRQRVVNETHTLPFGSDKRDEKLYRSTYKQIYGPRLCEKGYSMATTETVIPLPTDDLSYKYDAQEDYWVVKKFEGFFLKGKKCVLSIYDAEENRRSLKTEVDCDEWHFYLCEMMS